MSETERGPKSRASRPEGGGPRLPPAPEGWNGEDALQAAMEKHILSDGAHKTEEAAFNAAMGDLIISYLDSLPTKERLEALITLKGPAGFPEDRMLSDAGEDGEDGEDARASLLAAAKDLRAEGKLRRVRGPDGTVFWQPAGPAPGEDRDF